ncbi:unnamed protein product [Adineta steineri]|uniref:Apple domain-containing protein n=1 Tax=Adineta steineri TaxID=433720 RepID=A0A814F0L7_9BILA|nr:unnamed protein product [Adineta steineri]CAF1196244.1 unnamed protein product [Adineta steineri]
MIITRTVEQDIRSEQMFLIPDAKFQCANTTCLPFISVITTDIRNCQFACLSQNQCTAATFHRSTSNCELFDNMLNQNGNMLADVDATSINVISGTRFPPETTTTSTTSSTTTAIPKWIMTGNMRIGRSRHTVSTLANGSVLVTGGYSGSYLNSAELYNPSIGTWTTTGNISAGREYHTVSTLANGLVLVAGGQSSGSTYLNSAELYNPSTGTWATTANMSIARECHTASILANGFVLVAGGQNSGGYLNSAELY